jgi:signal transduction histidine kinase
MFLAGKKHEMFEVLVNLIKNSVEAMPDGGELHIACERQHREIMVKIKDTGIGICSENMGKLFTPFFTTKMNSGAGLGLATTRKIINDHGGHIFAASDVGKGALFTMVLPLKQPLDFVDVKN